MCRHLVTYYDVVLGLGAEKLVKISIKFWCLKRVLSKRLLRVPRSNQKAFKAIGELSNDKSYIGRSTGNEKLVSLRRLVCDKQHINKRDAVIENISFWEDSITAKLQFTVCYRWAITSYRLFQQTLLGAWIFSVDVCRQNWLILCVSVRFNTTEAINECDLKPAKRKQERFISVERLSNITINFVNLWSVSILCSPSQSLLLRDLARALRARTLRKVGSILNLSPLAKQSCGEVEKFDKSKSYSYVIKDAPTRRLA